MFNIRLRNITTPLQLKINNSTEDFITILTTDRITVDIPPKANLKIRPEQLIDIPIEPAIDGFHNSLN